MFISRWEIINKITSTLMVNPSDASSKLFSCKKNNYVYVMYITTGYEVKNKPDGEPYNLLLCWSEIWDAGRSW